MHKRIEQKRKVTREKGRKMTVESRIADLHQRREKSLKQLRESSMRITKGNNIAQFDTLLRDQVFFKL